MPSATAFQEAKILREATDENGRYDAARIAHLLDWSTSDIALYLSRDPSTHLALRRLVRPSTEARFPRLVGPGSLHDHARGSCGNARVVPHADSRT